MSGEQRSSYDVGYKRPPAHTRFKKGQSGNPKGRPKTKTFNGADVCDLLNEPLKVRSGGKSREMPSFEAATRQLARKALDKDLRAIIRFVRLCEEYRIIASPPAQMGSHVIPAPKDVDNIQAWLEGVTELVLADED